MENDNNGKFLFSGLPSNDSLEVEDDTETPKKFKRPGRNTGISFGIGIGDMDALKKMTGGTEEDINNAIQSINEMFSDILSGTTSRDALNKILKKYGADDKDIDEALKRMGISEEDLDEKMNLEKLLGRDSVNFDDLFGKGDENEEDDDEESEPSKFIFTLGQISRLLSEECFAQVKCKLDPDLYQNFCNRFGSGSYTVETLGAEIKINSRVACPLSKINEFKIVDYNDKYILLYGIPTAPGTQGIFIAAIENENGEFELVLPEYGNTFDVDNTELYDKGKNPELFEGDNFIFYDIDKIECGLDLLLVPVRSPLISPAKFGTIKQIASNIGDYSRWIRIGIIESNESSGAILLKRDFDLDLEKTKFDFYFRLNEETDPAILTEVMSFLGKINLNETYLAEESELKVAGNKLYIDVDLGSLLSNLPRWWDDKGNATL